MKNQDAFNTFLEKFDALIIAAPVRPNDGQITDVIVRYYNLEPIDESPWITVSERAGKVGATICDGDEFHETPQAAADAFLVECRLRMEEAGVAPAF